jgi:hypothetical protein
VASLLFTSHHSLLNWTVPSFALLAVLQRASVMIQNLRHQTSTLNAKTEIRRQNSTPKCTELATQFLETLKSPIIFRQLLLQGLTIPRTKPRPTRSCIAGGGQYLLKLAVFESYAPHKKKHITKATGPFLHQASASHQMFIPHKTWR